MGKHKKLLDRFLLKPVDFTYKELKTLLGGFGYNELNLGKTSGSRVAVINEETKHITRLHKPHQKNILKNYQIDLIENELKRMGIIR